MQIDALQNTNCRGEIYVHFYTKLQIEGHQFTILFEIITFLIRKPFFYVTVMENNSTDNFLCNCNGK